ncbi:MAG: FAD-dependent oxidoreductase [Opitutaceae bacterium]|jgi:hypothetical protein
MLRRLSLPALLLALLPASHGFAASYALDPSGLPLGSLPAGWDDAGTPRVNPNWGRDGLGRLRVLNKDEDGLLIYRGPLDDGASADRLTDAEIEATFQKTVDSGVYFGLVGRLGSPDDYYAARFSGDSLLELLKVSGGQTTRLASYVTRSRYKEGDTWKLTLAFKGNALTAVVYDAKGVPQSRVDAVDKTAPASGSFGVAASTFAPMVGFRIASARAAEAGKPPADFGPHAVWSGYPVLAPDFDTASVATAPDHLAPAYDIVVAGAGTGGWAAAVQAARLGTRVLLLEESDWIGGQMSAAAVTTMDEEGCWDKFPVRERGIYREFHESVVNHYYTLNKDPFRAYYAWPRQAEGGYEPRVSRAILNAFIGAARRRPGAALDLALRTKVVEVRKSGDTVTGVVIEHEGSRKTIACKILVEATEYGDVLPLAGARYRVGTVTSDHLDLNALVQSHTWTAVIREYPDGVPGHLRMKEPPPGYNPARHKGSQLAGPVVWGSAGKNVKGPRSWRVLIAWRGMADTASPATGSLSEERHTRAGLNGGRQDYPVTVADIEDPAVRRAGQRDGIYRTLSEIYYFQHDLGLPWGLAEDEGYDTEYQRRQIASLDLRPDLAALAVHMPQWPYVREARRMIGVYTLRASDLGRFENATLFPTAVAMGDYFMDLDHGATSHAVEADLDSGNPPRGGGPFQVPFEVFIPERVDGLVAAEKNISQSRLVNGATRLQPVTMLDGQAAGTIAALSIHQGIQPRRLNPVAVQAEQLKSGANLIQRWYRDVPWGTPLWRATQLLSLYGVMDRPGPFNKTAGKAIGAASAWYPQEPLARADAQAALARLAQLAGRPAPDALPAAAPLTWTALAPALNALSPGWRRLAGGTAARMDNTVTREDFALAAAALLVETGRPDWQPVR